MFFRRKMRLSLPRELERNSGDLCGSVSPADNKRGRRTMIWLPNPEMPLRPRTCTAKMAGRGSFQTDRIAHQSVPRLHTFILARLIWRPRSARRRDPTQTRLWNTGSRETHAGEMMTRVPKVAEKSNKNGGKGGEAILAAVFGSIFRRRFKIAYPNRTGCSHPLWMDVLNEILGVAGCVVPIIAAQRKHRKQFN